MTTTETHPADADAIVARLTAAEKVWADTSLADRAALLTEFRALVAEAAEDWIEIARTIKQLPEDSPLLGEEWISGPWAVLSFTGALLETVRSLDAGKDVLADYTFEQRPGSRVAVQVSPHSTYDKLLFSGFRCEVWFTPGVTEQVARDGAGLALRSPTQTNGVALVLGAGNIFSLAPLDTLQELFAKNRVAVLKVNPITDPLRPIYERIFAPFIELGVLEIISGGPQIGDVLAHHEGISAVRMTGSEFTHDAIVWGLGDAGKANKKAGTPRLTKEMTSELGGVSPIILVPGEWSHADLRFQAEHVATQRLHNSGHNCVASQILIISQDWPQKFVFINELRKAFREAPARSAWYPGATATAEKARSAHHHAEVFGAERTMLLQLDVHDPDESAFDSEYFGPILGIAEIPGRGEDFLDRAIAVANQRLHGTLGANIIIHPDTLKELDGQFTDALSRLRFGTIGVNAWTGVGYLTARSRWGAFPGHRLDDIQSGRGVVNNALLLDDTERSVVYGPFRPAPRSLRSGELSLTPRPAWFVQNRTAATTGRRLTEFVHHPQVKSLPAIFASALRG